MGPNWNAVEGRTTQTSPTRFPPPAALLPISPVLISVSTRQLFYLRWSLVASLFCWRVQCPLLQPLLQWLLFSSWQGHCLLVAWQGWLPLRRGNGMSSVITDGRESSGTKLEISANCGCFCPEEESLKSHDGKFLQRNLLPCTQPSLLPFSPLPYSLFRQ